ncbi:Rtr1/RPAP2 family protein [Paraphaeosphaeria minitans]|uniref:RNA polymerase II subunit B1 CTD phosphatase RPAP2 homolog n=1 Tax=Paraphaeosphaeria minitans TaxID=565426 RepID=A0A9P6GHF8_9PLEO|nr:Rtr1/RPAP2 family protein [Paraphaeosphaeria minitans]
MPPKSILKKTPAATSTQTHPAVAANPPPPARPVNQRHLSTAVQHARIYEQRKQVETAILDAVFELIDFPTSPDADPARPSPSDAHRFRQAIVPFQPSDYDGLIEERNIAAKCGYTLCPRPKGKAPSTAKKHFVETSKGVQIVDRKKLEMWCSDDCARRALFVKVQLNEEPAWLRQGDYGTEIDLMVENAEDHHKALPLRLKKAAAPAPEDAEADAAAAWAARDDALADLAMERGETPGRLSKANKDLITDKIKERVARFQPTPPSLPPGQSHMAIEGHVPKSARHAEPKDSDDEDDEQDWDKALPG